jgi:hypothetical protein
MSRYVGAFFGKSLAAARPHSPVTSGQKGNLLGTFLMEDASARFQRKAAHSDFSSIYFQVES